MKYIDSRLYTFRGQEKEGALTEIWDIMRLNGIDPGTTLWDEALIFLGLGQLDAAEQRLRLLLALGLEDREAGLLLVRILAEQYRIFEAYELFQTLEIASPADRELQEQLTVAANVKTGNLKFEILTTQGNRLRGRISDLTHENGQLIDEKEGLTRANTSLVKEMEDLRNVNTWWVVAMGILVTVVVILIGIVLALFI